MSGLTITEYTDAGCPFAWSAEPARWRLRRLYGDQLEWQVRMVGLAERAEDYVEKGFTPERQSSAFQSLAHKYEMPIDTSLRPRMAASGPASTRASWSGGWPSPRPRSCWPRPRAGADSTLAQRAGLSEDARLRGRDRLDD